MLLLERTDKYGDEDDYNIVVMTMIMITEMVTVMMMVMMVMVMMVMMMMVMMAVIMMVMVMTMMMITKILSVMMMMRCDWYNSDSSLGQCPSRVLELFFSFFVNTCSFLFIDLLKDFAPLALLS